MAAAVSSTSGSGGGSGGSGAPAAGSGGFNVDPHSASHSSAGETTTSGYSLEGGASPDELLLQSWSLAGDVKHSLKAHSSGVRSLCVDFDEQVVLTGSKHGSCRAWRLASHPCSAQASVYGDAAVAQVASVGDGAHAVAAEAKTVHIWDVRTGHVPFRVRLRGDHDSVACVLPLLAPPPFCASSSSYTGGGGAATTLAIASAKRIQCIDMRCGPKAVADWRIDAATSGSSSSNITALATILVGSRPFVAAGTAAGHVVLLDAHTGAKVTAWAALDPPSRVVAIAQYTASLVVVVGDAIAARVWNLAQLAHPRLRATLTGLPDGLRQGHVAVACYRDTSVLYVGSPSAGKVGAVRLATTDKKNDADDLATVKMELWPLTDGTMAPPTATMATTTTATNMLNATTNAAAAAMPTPTTSSSSSSSAKHTARATAKVAIHAIAPLPLRQVLLVGADDGCIKTVI